MNSERCMVVAAPPVADPVVEAPLGPAKAPAVAVSLPCEMETASATPMALLLGGEGSQQAPSRREVHLGMVTQRSQQSEGLTGGQG